MFPVCSHRLRINFGSRFGVSGLKKGFQNRYDVEISLFVSGYHRRRRPESEGMHGQIWCIVDVPENDLPLCVEEVA